MMNPPHAPIADRRLAPVLCSSCERPFTPRWLSGLQKWSRVCGNCGVLNLARFMEDNDTAETIAEISAGEQAGAFLRSLVKTNAQAEAQV